jgi:hypothetical protein
MLWKWLRRKPSHRSLIGAKVQADAGEKKQRIQGMNALPAISKGRVF